MEGVAWHQLGRVAEEQHDWTEAERCYRESLAIRERLVGFVCVRLEHDEEVYLSTLTDYAYISDLVVLPSHRGQGYGAALLQKAEEFARQQGTTTLKIEVLAKNQQAAAVYLHAGFPPYELVLLKQLE